MTNTHTRGENLLENVVDVNAGKRFNLRDFVAGPIVGVNIVVPVRDQRVLLELTVTTKKRDSRGGIRGQRKLEGKKKNETRNNRSRI